MDLSVVSGVLVMSIEVLNRCIIHKVLHIFSKILLRSFVLRVSMCIDSLEGLFSVFLIFAFSRVMMFVVCIIFSRHRISCIASYKMLISEGRILQNSTTNSLCRF